jgi:hypothetical protein
LKSPLLLLFVFVLKFEAKCYIESAFESVKGFRRIFGLFWVHKIKTNIDEVSVEVLAILHIFLQYLLDESKDLMGVLLEVVLHKAKEGS